MMLRTPGRTALGALSLAIGVCALALLLAATIAFHDVLVGTLLGDAVAVEVRGTDHVAVITTILLGVAAAGLVAAAPFAGALPAGLVLTSLGAAAAGTLLAGGAALVPALWLRRTPIVPLLAGGQARL